MKEIPKKYHFLMLLLLTHAFLFRFLLDHGSNVAAVNNDGELAIDISESDEMEELLQKEIDAQKVNLICLLEPRR